MDLIPSLAFTALVDLHPTFKDMDVSSQEYRAVRDDMVAAMTQTYQEGCPDLWEFARRYIAAVQEHPRESVTPTDLLGDPQYAPGRLLADCRCGATYSVLTGADEGDRLIEATRRHVIEQMGQVPA